MRASGISPNHIAQTYNNEGILPPGDYKEQKLGIPNTRKSHHLWSSSTVKQVLTNPIYLGHMVQLKTTNVSYKNKKQIRTLASPEYTAPAGENGGFILRHSTGAYPFSSEVDVPLTYADYYYLEALTRIKRRLQP